MISTVSRGILLALAAPLLLSGCGLFGSDGPLPVVAIGALHRNPDSAPPLSLPDRLLLDATAQGLVGYTGDGQVEAGLAERWTVIDEGRSYIFRLREAHWTDGRPVRAEEVVRALSRRIASPRLRSPMREEFGALRDIRAMTPRVIEIRLHRADPDLLDLLAQPDMAITSNGMGWGPWRARWHGGTAAMAPVPATDNGDDDDFDPVMHFWAAPAAAALAQYRAGDARIVFGGRFENWPLVAAAGVERSQIILDPVDGLFGLAVVSRNGILASETGRNAVAMAIDRERISRAFDGAGWVTRETLRRPATGQDVLPSVYPAWIDLSARERRVRARAIVAAATQAASGEDAALRIALPQGPGARLLFALLRTDLAAVGIAVESVPLNADADLRLIDEPAPNSDPGWYLRRLSCDHGVSCGDDLPRLLAAIDDSADPAARVTALGAAEEAIMRHAGFVALAAPMRWSLQAQPSLGVRANARARHSLIRLADTPD